MCLDVRDQGVGVAALVGMYHHARLLVRKQDVVILIQNMHARRGDFFISRLLTGSFKKLIIDV